MDALLRAMPGGCGWGDDASTAILSSGHPSPVAVVSIPNPAHGPAQKRGRAGLHTPPVGRQDTPHTDVSPGLVAQCEDMMSLGHLARRLKQQERRHVHETGRAGGGAGEVPSPGIARELTDLLVNPTSLARSRPSGLLAMCPLCTSDDIVTENGFVRCRSCGKVLFADFEHDAHEMYDDEHAGQGRSRRVANGHDDNMGGTAFEREQRVATGFVGGSPAGSTRLCATSRVRNAMTRRHTLEAVTSHKLATCTDVHRVLLRSRQGNFAQVHAILTTTTAWSQTVTERALGLYGATTHSKFHKFTPRAVVVALVFMAMRLLRTPRDVCVIARSLIRVEGGEPTAQPSAKRRGSKRRAPGTEPARVSDRELAKQATRVMHTLKNLKPKRFKNACMGDDWRDCKMALTPASTHEVLEGLVQTGLEDMGMTPDNQEATRAVVDRVGKARIGHRLVLESKSGALIAFVLLHCLDMKPTEAQRRLATISSISWDTLSRHMETAFVPHKDMLCGVFRTHHPRVCGGQQGTRCA